MVHKTLLLLLAVVVAVQAAPAPLDPANCGTTYIESRVCSDPKAPFVITSCCGGIFWSYPTNNCYIKLASNCTGASNTVLTLTAGYTANLSYQMSASVYEESTTTPQTQGAMRAFFGGGKIKAPQTGTTTVTSMALPTTNAFLTLTAGPKMNFYGVMYDYEFKTSIN